jgi:ParB-like chromosome segregation protein Spo0J
MKLHHVPLEDIVANPWRDTTLYPMDKDHVAELRDSIDDHGFFGGVKGRRVNGKVELGCGHARIEAARRAKLETVAIFIDDMDDDQMLQLMTDENATQAGANPAAVLNEVAAITRRLIEGLTESQAGTIVPASVSKAFENKRAIEVAQAKLQKRLTNPNAELPIGHVVIRAYLGQGKPDRSHRGERQIREAISTLKQSGRYDKIIEEALRKHPQPVTDVKESTSTTVAKTKPPKPRRRILDERCAQVFPNEHQFQAFREAVTTTAAQKVIPVTAQLALAKEIMRPKTDDSRSKHVAAPYIKMRVQEQVETALNAQRKIDNEEREQYLAEERERRVDAELREAERWLRSLISALAKLIDLAKEFPRHPKLGGFSARLDDLVKTINQLAKKLK